MFTQWKLKHTKGQLFLFESIVTCASSLFWKGLVEWCCLITFILWKHFNEAWISMWLKKCTVQEDSLGWAPSSLQLSNVLTYKSCCTSSFATFTVSMYKYMSYRLSHKLDVLLKPIIIIETFWLLWGSWLHVWYMWD